MEQWILSTSLEAVAEKLFSGDFMEWMGGRKGGANMEEMSKNLKFYLLAAKSLYYDAEEKHITSSDGKALVDELQELLYDGEDALETIDIHGIQSKQRKEHGSSATQNMFGLKESAETIRPLRRIPSTTSFAEESKLYGRDSDIEAIVGWLLSDDDADADDCSTKFALIVGPDGIGKSALAQFIFSDDRINAHFDLLLWVPVLDDFDALRMSRTLLEGLICQPPCNPMEEEDASRLQARLKDALAGKNFLLVLDSNCHRNPFDPHALGILSEFGGSRSKIIMTASTCPEPVLMRTFTIIHHLNPISHDEDCWKLFAERIFHGVATFSHFPQYLEIVGKRLVSKCQGNPFAIKLMGCILRLERNPEEWDRILSSPIWKLSERESDILPALWFSYLSLPQHLKRCFTHCSIYHCGYEFQMQDLISLWMAEGLLEPQNGKTIEQVGEEYFHDLKSRSLIHQSRQNESYFTMHCLVNNLATSLSGQFCLRLENNSSFTPVRKTRHLSYKRQEIQDVKKFEALSESKRLRTFLPLGPMEDNKTFKWDRSALTRLFQILTYLRVLSLSMYPITQLPDSIGMLKHLRYLDLSYTQLQAIPDVVCTWVNLQTLLLVCCTALARLPSLMRHLTKLRRLDTTGTPLVEMPLHMSALKDLQTLTNFVLGKGNGSGIKELQNLQLCGRLCITGLQNVIVEDILQANLEGKLQLTDISFKWDGPADNSEIELQVLDNLRPPRKVEKLSVCSYQGTRFPEWFGNASFTNLYCICLSDGENCFQLPSLGQLPFLIELYIKGFGKLAVIGKEFYGSAANPFPSLEVLHFGDMPEWQVWLLPGGGAFSRLRDLSMIECPKLTGSIPNTKGTPSIEGCPGLQI
ncbi:putative disease resistance RPP13-like protein 1 isoform X1 [Ziziphus jujuba]|uniref:Disease resistance RPP13-like protein 1 isoform X1 n=1 Tax=Ziziphus jujuba TaxID=326968 RepID=A0A6P4AWI2_ZIZJJ|nr:putative disease resistance RPP13-like protein 1 isoform X1 [Ziziphus jujuba]